MAANDGKPRELETPAEDRRWGAIGLFIVGLVVALALVVTLFGPTTTQEVNNVPAQPPVSPQNPPQPAQ